MQVFCSFSSKMVQNGPKKRITKTQPRRKAGLMFSMSYARDKVRAYAELVDDVAAFRHLYRRRGARICTRSLRHRYAYHQTGRLEVHNLCNWFLIHFHKSIFITFSNRLQSYGKFLTYANFAATLYQFYVILPNGPLHRTVFHRGG